MRKKKEADYHAAQCFAVDNPLAASLAAGDLPGTATVIVGGRHIAGPAPKPLEGDSLDDALASIGEQELAAPQVPVTKTERAAQDLGLDLSKECPVCRSLDTCECDEEDRTFVLRTRFDHDVKRVALCQRCFGPLSVVYLLVRHGGPPHRLAQFEAVYQCVQCAGYALAQVVQSEATAAMGRRWGQPPPEPGSLTRVGDPWKCEPVAPQRETDGAREPSGSVAGGDRSGSARKAIEDSTVKGRTK